MHTEIVSAPDHLQQGLEYLLRWEQERPTATDEDPAHIATVLQLPKEAIVKLLQYFIKTGFLQVKNSPSPNWHIAFQKVRQQLQSLR